MNYSEQHYDTKDLSDEDLLETFTPASEVEGPLFRQTAVSRSVIVGHRA